MTTQAADLSQASAITSVVEQCPDLDILINNAGAIPKGGLLELEDARWREA